MEIKIFLSSLQLKTKFRNQLPDDAADVRQPSTVTTGFGIEQNTFVLLVDLSDFYVKDLYAH